MRRGTNPHRIFCVSFILPSAQAWSSSDKPATPFNRRHALQQAATVAAGLVVLPPLWWMPSNVAHAVPEMPDTFDVERYIKSGGVQTPMGVSGQTGKSRPETGVLLRDGSVVQRDARSGDVSAEILVRSSGGSNDKVPVLITYASPWPLATGTMFDVECRDQKTGDGAFLAVTTNVKGHGLADLPVSFFVDQLMAPTSRFSFYGSPTDVKVKTDTMQPSNKYRAIDLSFSTLSQSTMTELPRKARLVATIPDGTAQAVMLVGSSSALRWNSKGTAETIGKVISSFRAAPAPQTGLKVRAKERRGGQ